MHSNRFGESAPINPLRICLSILVIVFVSEFLVMLVLPLALASSRTSWTEAGFDAGLLTIILIPFLWLTVIRPLRNIATMRARLLEQFVTLQEEERRRIAFDLHDEIGQSLTSVLLGLRTLDHAGREFPQRLEDLRKIISGAVQEVRRIANGLRPAILDHLGLTTAIQRLVEDVAAANDLEVEVAVELPPTRKLSNSIETTVYRIAQEALTNVVRHAEASRVSIELKATERWLMLNIEDDGKGTSDCQHTLTAARDRFGLAGMKERAMLLEGTFSLTSRPQGGTQIRVKIPLSKSAT